VAGNPPHIVFERVLAAVGECLDRQSAEALIQVRADRQMQERIEELADKSTEGILTPEERDEYEALVRVGNFVAILQADFYQKVTLLDWRATPTICKGRVIA
jgi:hypothetical protein